MEVLWVAEYLREQGLKLDVIGGFIYVMAAFPPRADTLKVGHIWFDPNSASVAWYKTVPGSHSVGPVEWYDLHYPDSLQKLYKDVWDHILSVSANPRKYLEADGRKIRTIYTRRY